ncbi:GNAT family N-acetyltransferase [Tuberibacillus sp. Marseille-P3662]|uniref:GNAT family N-acetyltransferase n=1 Tax=Tuberibacillus sp. Marseille-P3662 TaxID=1965358 RepID=UPI001592D8F1|nr:GNAT family N-acetyltransferase [Tuberibacillus sp. Marseille-P3662]
MIREALKTDISSIAKVHVDSWRSTYGSIVDQDVLQQLSYDEKEKQWQQILDQDSKLNRTFVAFDDTGDMAGFLSVGSNRLEPYAYEGELYAVYLLSDYQGQGYGRRLLKKGAEHLYEHGIDNMTVAVLSENPAVGFYQRMGAQPLGYQTIRIGRLDVQETILGWSSLYALN